jgi:histone H3/H4
VASDYIKVSVSLPAPLIERISRKAGSRGVSRYAAEALEALTADMADVAVIPI